MNSCERIKAHGPLVSECRIRMIGIPLLLRPSAGPRHGALMRDSAARQKYWIANGYSGNTLYEYRTERSFKENRPDNSHDLSFTSFTGTNHVIFNGSVYYHWADTAPGTYVTKFDLKQGIVESGFSISNLVHKDGKFIYDNSFSYVDIELDENGLWVIYSKTNDATHIYVTKIDAVSMDEQATWQLNIEPGSYGNGFVVCGILYLVPKATSPRTTITFAYDMYKSEYLTVDILLRTPYSDDVIMSYLPNFGRPHSSELYGWTSGSQLTYAILF